MILRFLVVVALVFAAAAAAAAQSLKPQWSRPVGGKTRLVGVEEYGRCSVFVDNNIIQVVAPANEVMWTWPYSKVSRFINPREVAVSGSCDAVAVAGDATHKSVWVARPGGTVITLHFQETPAEVAFDRAGEFIAVGTFSGSIYLHALSGELKWKRETTAAIVQGIKFSDDNQRIVFKGFAGAGAVSLAGHVEWSTRGSNEIESATAAPFPDYRWLIAVSEDGKRMWLRGEDTIDCVDDRGTVLAMIASTPNSTRAVRVSRDFAQVLVMTEKDLDPVSVERYEVPKPCRP